MKTRLLALATGLASMTASRPAGAVEEKYALGMFHFNVQYVCGGLVGASYPDPIRPIELEDLIVTESLAPVLELYAAHPNWGVDIEMQAYLLDVIAERHPAVLDLLRDLAGSGQIDVVSFHYSDQLFIAYPREDWERSNDLAQATFEEHGVPLSSSVFCQEGQSSMSMAPRFVERGYEVMVWPKNLWIAQYGDFVAEPLYAFGDAFMIAGAQGVAYDDGADLQITTTWTFFDDGELLATGGWNPYFPEQFVHQPDAVAEYEQGLLDLEADGWEITTVGKYVDAVRDRVPLAEPPALLDGTWQPQSTNAVSKWMGVRSLHYVNNDPADRDNRVRTLGALAHRELVAAETAAEVAGLDARVRLDGAWRLLALGQVTDATGINPYRGEVEYGLAHLAEVLRIARDVIEDAKAGADSVVIDPEAGTMKDGDEDPFAGEPGDAPLDVELIAADAMRETSVTWESIAPGHDRATIVFGAGDPTSGAWDIEARFPGEGGDTIVTTAALDESEPVVYQRSDFAFGDGEFHIALPIGMISLGQGRFLIKDTAHVHVAARIDPVSPDVGFRDETQPAAEAVTWVFHVFDGSAEQAVTLARRINSVRTVVR